MKRLHISYNTLNYFRISNYEQARRKLILVHYLRIQFSPLKTEQICLKHHGNAIISVWYQLRAWHSHWVTFSSDKQWNILQLDQWFPVDNTIKLEDDTPTRFVYLLYCTCICIQFLVPVWWPFQIVGTVFLLNCFNLLIQQHMSDISICSDLGNMFSWSGDQTVTQ